MVVDHLEDNLSQFLSQPVASDNAYNADTEPPTDEDAYISQWCVQGGGGGGAQGA